MTSNFVAFMKLRQHFRGDGTAKKTYGKKAAQTRATRFGQQAYQCRVCHGWHLASVPGKKD